MRLELLKCGRQNSPINPAVSEFKKNQDIIYSFIREFFQNILDADPVDTTKPKKIIFKLNKLKSAQQKRNFKTIFDKQYIDTLKETSSTAYYEDDKFLLIEEHNLKGLTGTADPNVTGAASEKAHWSKFSHSTFDSTKTRAKKSTMGSAGAGKITYNMFSGLRAMLYKTYRADDNQVWVGGKGEFNSMPKLRQNSYIQYYTWLSEKNDLLDTTNPEKSKKNLVPIKDSSFLDKTFALVARDKGDFGTTYIIPSPIESLGERKKKPLQNLDGLLNATIKEYAPAFIAGKLEVIFDDIFISKENIFEELEKRFPEDSEQWKVFDEIENFSGASIKVKSNWLDKEDFVKGQNIDITFVEDSDSDYERVKEQYDQGQLIRVQVPIRLTKKINHRPSKKILPIDVYLKKRPPGKGKLAFVLRAFLNISGEDAKIINNGYDIIAITKISNDDISIFCGTIENPAHTNFNDVDNDKATNNFQLIKDTRSYIRNAPYLAFQLFENLSQKEVIDEFMSNVFGIALPVLDSSINKRKKKKKKSTKTEPVKILVPENDIANELDTQEVHVINDEIVEKGQLLITLANRGQIIEVLAPCRGKILSIFCSVGDKVTVHQLLGKIKKMALVEPPILEQIGFEPFIIKGTGKCLLSNLPLMIEVTATSNSLNKLRKPLESSENGFKHSKISNALGCELINRQRDSISIEINSPDFYFELDKFDARFSTTFSIKY